MQSASQSQSAPSDAVADWLHAVSALGLRVQLCKPQRALSPDQQTGSRAGLLLTRLSLLPWTVCMYVGAAGVKLGSTAWTTQLTALQLFLQFPYVYATQASNTRLAGRVPGRPATHACEPRPWTGQPRPARAGGLAAAPRGSGALPHVVHSGRRGGPAAAARAANTEASRRRTTCPRATAAAGAAPWHPARDRLRRAAATQCIGAQRRHAHPHRLTAPHPTFTTASPQTMPPRVCDAAQRSTAFPRDQCQCRVGAARLRACCGLGEPRRRLGTCLGRAHTKGR